MPTTLRARSLMLWMSLALLLTGCTPAASVEPAEDAANPNCARTMIALPDALGNVPARKTTSQATAVWGNPSQVVLRCGVTPPPPTTDPCASVNGVDWLLVQIDQGEMWRATTYGRDPAVEVLFNSQQMSSSTLLADLAQPVNQLPKVRECSTQTSFSS